ncbi:hypothetical protein [Pusillimonas sp. ANT_WB101]|uniref:hypothetical protein n=1 Tax=Pusillimonas sp. ANT_WB101 TaxID=2597356 RepID=UPI0011EDF7C6|nr:hypothetical protein [Pusillimonas sp. ANT_WB101]KAA0890954.1 hypothetical protein FQ179_15020 [Pusillimonas sp. ANT_WB101]
MKKPSQVICGALAMMAIAAATAAQAGNVARFEVGIVVKHMCEVSSGRSVTPARHAAPGVSCTHKRSYRIVPPNSPSTPPPMRVTVDDTRLKTPVWTIEF